MADLQTDVRYIKGIGEARAKALSKLGIGTLQDLIGYFPRRYEDRTMTRTIRELELGETVCVRAMIANDPVASRISGGRKSKSGEPNEFVLFNTLYSDSFSQTAHTLFINPIVDIQSSNPENSLFPNKSLFLKICLYKIGQSFIRFI